jgi:hypothetical protein
MTYAEVINGEIVRNNLTLPIATSNASLGTKTTVDELVANGYYPIVGTEPPFNRETHINNGVRYEIIGQEVHKIYDIIEIPIEVLIANARESMTNAIDNLVNSKARELRWDDIKSARAGAGVPLDGTETASELAIHNEALSLAKWDRAVWGKANEIEQAVLSGARPMPTVDEVLSEMPIYGV